MNMPLICILLPNSFRSRKMDLLNYSLHTAIVNYITQDTALFFQSLHEVMVMTVCSFLLLVIISKQVVHLTFKAQDARYFLNWPCQQLCVLLLGG